MLSTTQIIEDKNNIIIVKCSCGTFFNTKKIDILERCHFCTTLNNKLPSTHIEDLEYLSLFLYDTILLNYMDSLNGE